MVDGQLESKWSQLHYATRTLSPVRLVLKVALFLLLHCTGVFLCFWGVLTRLDARDWHTLTHRPLHHPVQIPFILFFYVTKMFNALPSPELFGTYFAWAMHAHYSSCPWQ